MALLVVLLVCLDGLQKAAAEDCFADCATLFGECVEDMPYTDCLSKINNADQEFIAAGCVSGCTPTSAMTALNNAGGGGSEGEDGEEGEEAEEGEDGEEDEEGGATSACTSGMTGTAGTPLTSACYSLNSRTFKTQVPSGSGPFPVLILLHGAGGAGDAEIRNIGSMAAIATAFILVAPDGIAGEWSVDGPTDVTFVSIDLLKHVAGFSNVQPSFTIVGYSKGAFLTNKILVENDDKRIIAGVTQCTQLSSSHYNNGSFYMGGSIKASLTKRRLLQVTGANDNIIPPGGETGGADDTEGFLEWKESVYRYAQAYGYSGQQVNPTTDAVLGENVIYLNGYVQGYNFVNEGHMAFTNDAQQAVLFNFLNVQSPPPSSDASATGNVHLNIFLRGLFVYLLSFGSHMYR